MSVDVRLSRLSHRSSLSSRPDLLSLLLLALSTHAITFPPTAISTQILSNTLPSLPRNLLSPPHEALISLTRRTQARKELLHALQITPLTHHRFCSLISFLPILEMRALPFTLRHAMRIFIEPVTVLEHLLRRARAIRRRVRRCACSRQLQRTPARSRGRIWFRSAR